MFWLRLILSLALWFGFLGFSVFGLAGCQSRATVQIDPPDLTMAVEGVPSDEYVWIMIWEGADEAEAIRVDSQSCITRQHQAVRSGFLGAGQRRCHVRSLSPGSYTVGVLAYDPREAQAWAAGLSSHETPKIPGRWEVRTLQLRATSGSQLSVRFGSRDQG